MKMTKEWVENQIKEYKVLLTHLDANDPNDKKLNTIWSSTLNTLNSVLEVINLEMTTYK